MLEEERSISSYAVVLNTLDPHTQRRADPYEFERAAWWVPGPPSYCREKPCLKIQTKRKKKGEFVLGILRTKFKLQNTRSRKRIQEEDSGSLLRNKFISDIKQEGILKNGQSLRNRVKFWCTFHSSEGMEKGNNVEENSFEIMIKNFANFMKNIHLQTDNVE